MIVQIIQIITVSALKDLDHEAGMIYLIYLIGPMCGCIRVST